MGSRKRTDQVGGTWCHHHRQTSDLDKPAAVRVSVSSPETQHRGDMTMFGAVWRGGQGRERSVQFVCTVLVCRVLLGVFLLY